MADLTSGDGRCDGIQEPAARKAPDEYDHDRISIYDLIELGVANADSSAGDAKLPAADVTPDMLGEGLAPVRATESMPFRAGAGAAGQFLGDAVIPPSPTCVPECTIQAAELPIAATPTAFPPQLVPDEPAGETTPESGDTYPFEVLDLAEETPPAPDDLLDHLWHLEVPEAEDEEGRAGVIRTGVSSDERALHLALVFLRDEGLYSEGHLDLLTDIIRQRGWNSVQFQVRGLVRAGYDIAQIHRMLQLTDAWLHCVESDTLAPERWHGGKRLTWLEAAQLLDFLGHDAAFEQIADFLSSEQEVWQGLRRDSGQLATFKNYLFGYRLSPRTQVDDGIWQVNLDPRDMRSFDGSRNPLYLTSWWDEPLEGGAPGVRQMFGAICDPARIAEWLSSDAEELF